MNTHMDTQVQLKKVNKRESSPGTSRQLSPFIFRGNKEDERRIVRYQTYR